MDDVTNFRHRVELNEILFRLSQDQDFIKQDDNLENIYKQLEALYRPNTPDEKFRHYYSDIFKVLAAIKNDTTLGDINILGQNITIILRQYKPERYDENGELIDISNSLNKLYDHISLDIARILYIESSGFKTIGGDNIDELKAQITKADEELKNVLQIQEELETEIHQQQKEYIAILGIFAAIVLTFTGSIAFSSSVLNNINSASVYRVILITLVLGLVINNVLFGLFYYINGIIKNKKHSKLSPFIVSNIIIVVLIIATVAAWFFNITEYRYGIINYLK